MWEKLCTMMGWGQSDGDGDRKLSPCISLIEMYSKMDLDLESDHENWDSDSILRDSDLDSEHKDSDSDLDSTLVDSTTSLRLARTD